MAAGDGKDARIDAIIFSLVYAYLLYSWIADTGVIPWFEYQQMAIMGSYSPVMTPIGVLIFFAPIFGVIMSYVAVSARRIMFRYTYKRTSIPSRPAATAVPRRYERPTMALQAAPSRAINQALSPTAAVHHPPKSPPPQTVATTKQPVRQPAYVAPAAAAEPALMPATAMLIWALVFTAIGGGVGILMFRSASGAYTYEQFDVAKGGVPRTSHVELTGVEHPEMQFEVTTAGKHFESNTVYVPLLPPHWTIGMPVVYFVEMRHVRASNGDFLFKDGLGAALSQERGRLSHLPGVAAYGFTRHGLTLGSPHFALKKDGFDDDSMWFGVVVVSAILAITFLLCALMFSLTNRRVRRHQRLRS